MSQGRPRHPPDLRLQVAGQARRLHQTHLEGARREAHIRAAGPQAEPRPLPTHRPPRGHQEEGGGEVPGPRLHTPQHGPGTCHLPNVAQTVK